MIQSANATQFKKMKEAADVIGEKLYSRIARAKAAKALRAELKKLPVVCRAGFMKMRALKESTALMRSEA